MKKRDTIVFTVRTTPSMLQSATALAQSQGMRRNRFIVKLLERELAAVDCDQPTDPAKEETSNAITG